MIRAWLIRMRNLSRQLLDRLYLPKKKYCCVCDARIGRFFAYRGGRRAPLMVAMQTVGSNVQHFGCPRCNCHDRERHLFLYLKSMALFDRFEGAAILHFAPEQRLSARIAAAGPERYVVGDLYPTSEDIETIDMLAIKYPSASFDFVIANHVLEHVDNDLLALAELRRVLKPGGFAILQTPFSRKLTRTFSDPGIDTPVARYHAFGQEDHVRLYGSDIFARIESVGFKSHVAAHDELLTDFDPLKFGVNEAEPFFLFQRIDA